LSKNQATMTNVKNSYSKCGSNANHFQSIETFSTAQVKN
jgi:hypothetical protein